MDETIFHFPISTLATPLLDLVMVFLTYGGLAALPIGGIGLLSAGRRKLGTTVLAAIAASFLLTMIFQFLALRPRPVPLRTMIPTPGFPTFPSGHAAIAFGVAVLLSLVAWRSGDLDQPGLSRGPLPDGGRNPTGPFPAPAHGSLRFSG